jgi:hypothetical protein
VHIITGCAFSLFTALELFTGTGDFTVLGGKPDIDIRSRRREQQRN